MEELSNFEMGVLIGTIIIIIGAFIYLFSSYSKPNFEQVEAEENDAQTFPDFQNSLILGREISLTQEAKNTFIKTINNSTETESEKNAQIAFINSLKNK